jgi:hypothetical protein
VTPDENNGDNTMQTAKKHGKWTQIGSTSQTGTNHFTSDLESCAQDAHTAVSRTMNDTNVMKDLNLLFIPISREKHMKMSRRRTSKKRDKVSTKGKMLSV